MMGTRMICSNSTEHLLLFVVLMICMAAAPATCPRPIDDAGSKDAGSRHVLNNVLIFDGHPEQLTDLIPENSDGMDHWQAKHIDPYLVCRYKDTSRTVAFRIVGVNSCAGLKPTRTYFR